MYLQKKKLDINYSLRFQFLDQDTGISYLVNFFGRIGQVLSTVSLKAQYFIYLAKFSRYNLAILLQCCVLGLCDGSGIEKLGV